MNSVFAVIGVLSVVAIVTWAWVKSHQSSKVK